MTPPSNNPSQIGLHLTDDQLGELLDCAGGPAHLDTAAEAHLRACPTCAAEFASLCEALSLFREASIAHAEHEFARMRPLERPAYPVLPAHRPYSKTLFWVAASAILMAGVLPLEMRWQRTLAPQPAVVAETSSHTPESDEALLEDINRDLSRSVPASMQTLDNPTGSAGSASATSTDTLNQSVPQASTQRKD